jgi:hypothetical protein
MRPTTLMKRQGRGLDRCDLMLNSASRPLSRNSSLEGGCRPRPSVDNAIAACEDCTQNVPFTTSALGVVTDTSAKTVAVVAGTNRCKLPSAPPS